MQPIYDNLDHLFGGHGGGDNQQWKMLVEKELIKVEALTYIRGRSIPNQIMIIDEAQNLSFEVLEQIRLLSNLETDSQKLLQIILMGQPELNEKLNHRLLRQLKQRILVHYNLRSLSFKETCKYVEHRLTLSEGRENPAFSYWAMRKIHRKSKGIPRIINNLCDKSLLSAFVKSSTTVHYGDVRRAIKEIEFA